MKAIPDTPTASQVFLPTEIVIEIVSIIAEDASRRQITLYKCCLISRQWYSVAVPFLYENPQFEKGYAFRKLTAVICPPIGAPRSKTNLGSLIRRLDMGRLVYHSSNSLTARLLGKVKENLEVFIAPAASFSLNCLASLSKCGNLRYLNLSLVNEPMSFQSLKKAINRLEKLTTFRVPPCTINEAPADLNPLGWPPRLQRLQMSGTFRDHMDALQWPEQITSLTLKHCTNLSLDAMSNLLSPPHLGLKLKRLKISTFNRGLRPELIHVIPIYLPSLTFLSVPGDLVLDTFFDIIRTHGQPSSLEVLEFALSYTGDSLNFSYQSLIDILDDALTNLYAVGVHEYHYDEAAVSDLDETLVARAEKQGCISVPAGVEIGVYRITHD